MQVELVTKHYVMCQTPECKTVLDSPIDHVIQAAKSRTSRMAYAGPWYCKTCRTGWVFDVSVRANGATVVDMNAYTVKDKLEPHYVILELAPQDKPVYFMLKAEFTEGSDHVQFFYEESSCPTNWLRDVIKIYSADNDDPNDPHGLFTYVSHIPKSVLDKMVDTGAPGASVEDLGMEDLFPEMFPKIVDEDTHH